MSYNPKPTRVWSRVQHPCTFTVDGSYNSAYSPLTGKTTSLFEADYYNKLLYKGNILQYKKNTSNLTKSQRYSQICKGMWTNRTKSYATQTQTYTNPNTSNLKQVNFINVPTNGNTTYIPGPFNFNIPAPNGCPSNVIKEGGSLLCNTVVNPCTDEVIDVSKVLECYPTYCSDVPGPVIDLCWNPKLDTWYPRQNLTMPTSGTKWPEGYKGLVSAVKGCYNIYIENGLNTIEPTSGIIKVLEGVNGTISFKSNVTITEVFLVGGGNAGLTGKFVSSSADGGWGGAGGGFAKLNNIPVLARTPITLTVGTGGVYPVSYGIQSSFTYNGVTTLSVKDSNDWAAYQNNEGGLNNGFITSANHIAQDGYQYDGVWYGGGGGYGGRPDTWLDGGNGGLGGGGGGGGYTGNNGGFGGQGTGGTAGNVTVNAGSSSIYGGGGGYGIITGNGGNGGAAGGGAGGTGAAAGGGGGGGVNTGGGGGGGGYPTDSGIPGNGGSGIIIIKYTIAV